ncbi:MAG: hypothetical protein M3137_14255 [Actinomycetota bacterium]|nr:hypothetical protein [Actinomycetota bacterium]
MRQRWFSKRALLWHLLLAIIVPGCLYAGWWQAHRAIGGNTLSWAYTVEWPVFAVVAVIGWWQLIMEHPSEVEARRQERIRRAQPRPVVVATPQMLAANRAALEMHRAELGPASSAGGDLAVIEDDSGQVHPVASGGMSTYNAYLATLATQGRAKTWRNPRGMPQRPEESP